MEEWRRRDILEEEIGEKKKGNKGSCVVIAAQATEHLHSVAPGSIYLENGSEASKDTHHNIRDTTLFQGPVECQWEVAELQFISDE